MNEKNNELKNVSLLVKISKVQNDKLIKYARVQEFESSVSFFVRQAIDEKLKKIENIKKVECLL